MHASRRRAAACLLLLLALAALRPAARAEPAPAPWPQEMGDVPADSRMTWGRLENGLRYVIRHNAEPQGRASFVLLVRTGSVHEQEDQLGYAHLVEHLLFEGTRHFPGSTLVEQMQREGVKFGADLNAFTSYTSTHYDLDLPDARPARIAWGLDIMRDFADGGIFDATRLKQELKVIESERRDRETAQTLQADRFQAFLLPDSLLPRRSPIGSPRILEQATPERAAQFYHRWYRPDRMTVIAVGDFPPELMEKMIREKFATMEAGGPPPAEPDLHSFAGTGQLTAQYFPSTSDGGVSVMLCNVNPRAADHDTVAGRRSEIVRLVGAGILQARLSDIARAAPLEYGPTQVTQQDYINIASYGQIQMDSTPQYWRRTLRVAEQELRRAVLHGFTPAEIQTQTARLRAYFHEAIETEPTWPSEGIAQQLRGQLEQDRVYTSAEAAWKLAQSAIEPLGPEAVAAQFNQDWGNGSRRIAVMGTRRLKLDPADIVAAYKESAQGLVLTHEQAKPAEFEYTNFGRAGEIKQRDFTANIAVHSLRFANGVRLNLKQTDYEAGRIYLRLRLGRGLAQEPGYLPGLGQLTGIAYSFGGVMRHTPAELERILAGKALSLQFSVAEDAFYFDGYADRDSLDMLFQLCTAYLTDPAYRLAGFQTAMGLVQSQYQQASRDPVQYVRAYAPVLVSGGDSRYGFAPPAKIFDRNPGQIQQWLQPVLQQGPVEIGLAGDLDVESTIAAAARTFGTLPARQTPAPVDLKRRPAYPSVPVNRTWRIPSPEKKAMVRVHWPGTDDNDFHVQRRLNILAAILTDRLRVKLRVELGATYAPQAESWGSRVYPGYGYLFADVVTAPGLAGKVAELVRGIAADLAAKGITPDEFERARQPVIATLKQHLRNNSYWLWYILTYLQEDPAVATLPLTRSEDYSAITLAELEDLAKTHLRPDRACTVISIGKE